MHVWSIKIWKIKFNRLDIPRGLLLNYISRMRIILKERKKGKEWMKKREWKKLRYFIAIIKPKYIKSRKFIGYPRARERFVFRKQKKMEEEEGKKEKRKNIDSFPGKNDFGTHQVWLENIRRWKRKGNYAGARGGKQNVHCNFSR